MHGSTPDSFDTLSAPSPSPPPTAASLTGFETVRASIISAPASTGTTPAMSETTEVTAAKLARPQSFTEKVPEMAKAEKAPVPALTDSAGLNSDSELSELTEEEQDSEKQSKSKHKQKQKKAASPETVNSTSTSTSRNNSSSSSSRGRGGSRRGRKKRSTLVPAPMWGWAVYDGEEDQGQEAGEEDEQVQNPLDVLTSAALGRQKSESEETELVDTHNVGGRDGDITMANPVGSVASSRGPSPDSLASSRPSPGLMSSRQRQQVLNKSTTRIYKENSDSATEDEDDNTEDENIPPAPKSRPKPNLRIDASAQLLLHPHPPSAASANVKSPTSTSPSVSRPHSASYSAAATPATGPSTPPHAANTGSNAPAATKARSTRGGRGRGRGRGRGGRGRGTGSRTHNQSRAVDSEEPGVDLDKPTSASARGGVDAEHNVLQRSGISNGTDPMDVGSNGKKVDIELEDEPIDASSALLALAGTVADIEAQSKSKSKSGPERSAAVKAARADIPSDTSEGEEGDGEDEKEDEQAEDEDEDEKEEDELDKEEIEKEDLDPEVSEKEDGDISDKEDIDEDRSDKEEGDVDISDKDEDERDEDVEEEEEGQKHKRKRDADADEDKDSNLDAEEKSDRDSNVDPDEDPDAYLEEEDTDLQPAHRVEALEFLARIELKFALLREKVYVEKMEELAWEESLIGNGTHPELHYIHSELSRRKNKRLELAKRKCEFEVSNVTKKRRIDESSVWQTWKVQRDQLQTDIIAETNRKRRKLERERRAADRPQPVRRVPLPPDPRFSYSLPPPPTLRQVVDSFPLPNESNILTRHQDSTRFNVPKTRPHVNGVNGVNGTGAKRSRLNGIAPAHPPLGLGSLTSLVAYPELSTLSSAEVQGDLERLLIGARRSGMSNQGPPLPVGMGVDRMGNIPGPINVGLERMTTNMNMNLNSNLQGIGPGIYDQHPAHGIPVTPGSGHAHISPHGQLQHIQHAPGARVGPGTPSSHSHSHLPREPQPHPHSHPHSQHQPLGHGHPPTSHGSHGLSGPARRIISGPGGPGPAPSPALSSTYEQHGPPPPMMSIGGPGSGSGSTGGGVPRPGSGMESRPGSAAELVGDKERERVGGSRSFHPSHIHGHPANSGVERGERGERERDGDVVMGGPGHSHLPPRPSSTTAALSSSMSTSGPNHGIHGRQVSASPYFGPRAEAAAQAQAQAQAQQAVSGPSSTSASSVPPPPPQSSSASSVIRKRSPSPVAPVAPGVGIGIGPNGAGAKGNGQWMGPGMGMGGFGGGPRWEEEERERMHKEGRDMREIRDPRDVRDSRDIERDRDLDRERDSHIPTSHQHRHMRPDQQQQPYHPHPSQQHARPKSAGGASPHIYSHLHSHPAHSTHSHSAHSNQPAQAHHHHHVRPHHHHIVHHHHGPPAGGMSGRSASTSPTAVRAPSLSPKLTRGDQIVAEREKDFRENESGAGGTSIPPRAPVAHRHPSTDIINLTSSSPVVGKAPPLPLGHPASSGSSASGIEREKDARRASGGNATDMGVRQPPSAPRAMILDERERERERENRDRDRDRINSIPFALGPAPPNGTGAPSSSFSRSSPWNAVDRDDPYRPESMHRMSPNYSRGLSSLSGPPTAASSPLSPTRTKTLPPRPNSPAVSLNVSGPGPSSHSASSSSSRIRSPPQRRSPPLQNSLPQNQNPNFNGSKVQAPLPSSGATPVSKSAISSVTSGPTSVAESTASSQAPDAHKHLSPTLPSKTSQVLAGGLGSNSTLPPLTSTSLITAPTALSDSKTKDLSITNGAPLPLPMMNVEGKS